RRTGGHEQAALTLLNAVVEMEQTLFPVTMPGEHIQAIETQQVDFIHALEQAGTVVDHPVQGQIHGQGTGFGHAVAGRLQQMGAPAVGCTPDVDAALFGGLQRVRQALQHIQDPGIGATEEAVEGCLVPELDAQGQLHGLTGHQTRPVTTVTALPMGRLNRANGNRVWAAPGQPVRPAAEWRPRPARPSLPHLPSRLTPPQLPATRGRWGPARQGADRSVPFEPTRTPARVRAHSPAPRSAADAYPAPACVRAAPHCPGS